MRTPSGFTLIEVIVVLVILGILASIVAPNVIGNVDKSRVVKAKQDMRAIESALQMYRVDNFQYPSTDQGLQALVERPAGGNQPKNWQEGGYLKKLPKDPWQNAYQYISPGESGDYDLYTLGADGAPGGAGYNADINVNNLE